MGGLVFLEKKEFLAENSRSGTKCWYWLGG